MGGSLELFRKMFSNFGFWYHMALFSGGFSERTTLPTYSLYHADANELEITAKEEILSRIDMMFHISLLQDLERQVKVFIDVIIEGRKLQRLEDRAQCMMWRILTPPSDSSWHTYQSKSGPSRRVDVAPVPFATPKEIAKS
jgi:hypothetical protein